MREIQELLLVLNLLYSIWSSEHLDTLKHLCFLSFPSFTTFHACNTASIKSQKHTPPTPRKWPDQLVSQYLDQASHSSITISLTITLTLPREMSCPIFPLPISTRLPINACSVTQDARTEYRWLQTLLMSTGWIPSYRPQKTLDRANRKMHVLSIVPPTEESQQQACNPCYVIKHSVFPIRPPNMDFVRHILPPWSQ